MKEKILLSIPGNNIYQIDRISVPRIAERGLNSADQKREFEARLQQAQTIVQPRVRGAVEEVLEHLYGYCWDWRIHVMDSDGAMMTAPGRAANPGALEGTHDPIVVELPAGVKLAQVLPFI